MPHNLYLHSGIIRNYSSQSNVKIQRDNLKYGVIDSTIALLFAFLINASILILASATFYRDGYTQINDITIAYKMLAPLLGSSIAPILFSVALLCCGLSSTITATLTGQIVMEGFINIALPNWMRRLITRLVAILPAIWIIVFYGESHTAQLLILSQVILGIQLPFAIVPLVIFTASHKKMGHLRAPIWMTITASLIAIIIILLNLQLIYDTFL